MIRILSLVAGLAGAAGLSQFPEFSQQYLQRLAGAVDELSRVIADFDASAEGVGMTRIQALDALTDGAFQQARQADMRATIARGERLSADLAALREASMIERALQPQRFTDPEIARAAWEDFKPAVPVTPTGLGFAGVGFITGGVLLAGLLALVRWPFRRRNRNRNLPPRPQPNLRHAPVPGRVEPSLRGGRAASPALPIGFLTRTGIQPRKLVAHGQNTQIATLMIEPDGALSGQSGAGADLVLVCHDGEGRLSHDGQSRMIGAGELALLPPSVAWEIANDGDVPLRLFTIEPRSALGAEGSVPLPIPPRGA